MGEAQIQVKAVERFQAGAANRQGVYAPVSCVNGAAE